MLSARYARLAPSATRGTRPMRKPPGWDPAVSRYIRWSCQAHRLAADALTTPSFPASYQGLAACRKGMVVQITTAFPSVPQVQSAMCPGVTGPHLLCCCVSVRWCSAVWFLNLHHPFLNQEANMIGVLITIDGTVECVVRHSSFPPGFRSQARCFL